MNSGGIAANQIIHKLSDDSYWRVLWVAADSSDQSYWICVHEASNIPQIFDYGDLIESLKQGLCELASDRWRRLEDDDKLSEASRQVRNQSWSLISGIVCLEPDIYDRTQRWNILQDLESQTGLRVNRAYELLGKYWKNGMNPNALLPKLSRNRKPHLSPDGKRDGRPKREGANGKKMVEDDIPKFRHAVETYYLSSKRLSLKDTYTNLLRDSYSIRGEDGQLVTLPADDVPSLAQFKYWYYKNRNVLEETMSRKGKTSFQLNNRAVLDSSERLVMGPGAVVQIDSTIADFSLVRRSDRTAIIGRPILYFAKDVFSRMIVGVHVTLDKPSWNTALMAVANIAEDKVTFCSKYNVNIKEEDWPCHFVPQVLVADRGEMESQAADALTEKLGIRIDNTPPYRGDLKGIVEQTFHSINLAISPLVPGAIPKDFGERCVKDARLNSKLDIYQFTAIVIECVLYMNNYCRLDGYQKTDLMWELDVPAVPIKMWNMGCKYLTGQTKYVPVDAMLCAVFPREQATVAAHGIIFRGVRYTCDRAEEEHWFEKARTTATWRVEVAYDPRDISRLYILPEQGDKPCKCRLLPRSQRYDGITAAEIRSEHEANLDEKAEWDRTEAEAGVRLSDFKGRILREAEEMSKEGVTRSAAARLRDIKDNRDLERQEMSGMVPGNLAVSPEIQEEFGYGPVPIPDAIDRILEESMQENLRKMGEDAIPKSTSEVCSETEHAETSSGQSGL